MTIQERPQCEHRQAQKMHDKAVIRNHAEVLSAQQLNSRADFRGFEHNVPRLQMSVQDPSRSRQKLATRCTM